MPAGVAVTFHCQLAESDELGSYWVVDGITGVQRHLDELQSRGFFVGKSSQHGITTLSLNVTATIDKNGTVISCFSVELHRTDYVAVLAVIECKSLSSLCLYHINLYSYIQV